MKYRQASISLWNIIWNIIAFIGTITLKGRDFNILFIFIKSNSNLSNYLYGNCISLSAKLDKQDAISGSIIIYHFFISSLLSEIITLYSRYIGVRLFLAWAQLNYLMYRLILKRHSCSSVRKYFELRHSFVRNQWCDISPTIWASTKYNNIKARIDIMLIFRFSTPE